MASGLSNGNMMVKNQVRNSVTSTMYPDERKEFPQPSAIPPGFGGGNTGWKNNIWGNARLGANIANNSTENENSRASNGTNDGAIEGKTGSGSLLSTSESEGWAGRNPRPWNVSAATSFAPSASNVNVSAAQMPGHSNHAQPSHNNVSSGAPAAYLQQKFAAIGTAAFPSSSQRNFADEAALALPTGVSSLGLDSHEVGDRNNHQFNMASFGNNNAGSNLQATSVTMGDVDYTVPNSTMNSLEFQPSHTRNHTSSTVRSTSRLSPHSQASLGSVSAPYTATQPNRQTFHHHNASSNLNRQSMSQVDLASNLAQLDLQNNPYAYGQQTASQRPAYQSHSSFDGTWSRLKYNLSQEDGRPTFRSYTPDGHSTDSTGAHLARHVDRGFSSPTTSDYNRSANSPFYSTGDTQASASSGQAMPSPGFRYINHGHDEQTELLDRKLRGVQRERDFVQQPLNQASNGTPLQQAYKIVNYQPTGMSQLATIYGMNPLNGLSNSVAPRGQYADQGPNDAMRSTLLQEFRTNNKGNKRYELKDIYNHIVEFCGDQHGSRFIQQKLETANSDEKERVFQEIKPNALQLMMDLFGNYVIQKLFEHGNQAQKKSLAQQMMGHIHTLSVQMYGCRVVQKALEHVLTDQQTLMVRELENNVIKCVKDQNGNHVIQKAIERVPAEHIQFIINDFRNRIQHFATHPYGCRVIQRMLEHCTDRDRQSILKELSACTATLIPDQFGNYVIQHVIEHGAEEDRSRVISVVISQLVYFSKHKFASNVVEKSIEFGNQDQRAEILKALTTPNEQGDSALLGLIRDQYGNYVVQKVLDMWKGPDHQLLVEKIGPLLTHLKRFSYGKQISAIEKQLQKSRCPSRSVSPTGNGEYSSPCNNRHDADALSSGDEVNPTPTPSSTDRNSSPTSSLPSANTSVIGCTIEVIKHHTTLDTTIP